MPDFANPFSGNVPRPMTPEELIRAIRLTLAAEEEAVHMYTALAEAARDELAKKVLLDIANEERQHAGEFLHLLRLLAPDEEGFLVEGQKEVEEMARQVRRTAG
jgi:rubrerythrin